MQATPPPSPTPTLAIPRHCATSVPVLTSTTSSRGNFFVINSTYLVRTPCLDPLNEEDRRTWFELCHHDSFCTAANNLIRDILAKNGLTSKNNSLFGGRDETKPRDYGQTTWAIHISQLVELPQTWHPIIVIGAEWKPESSLAHWARVVPEMKDAFDRFLDANQIPGPGVNVRMESPEAYRPRQLHALVGRPDLDSAWPGIKAQVRAVLQGLEEARDQWDCIALFGLGYLCDNSSDGGDMPEETLPTVYISFHRDCSEARWTPVREALASLLGTYELSFYLEHSAPEAVDVFRLYGQRHLANCWSALRANGPYTGTTCLGQDISATSYTVAEGGSKPISVNPPTGTLGCHIELRLQEDGPWEQFALTTYQTVRGAINGFARDRRGSPGTPSPSSALHRTDRAGFRPGDADVADALMQCPSLACYDRTLSSYARLRRGHLVARAPSTRSAGILPLSTGATTFWAPSSPAPASPRGPPTAVCSTGRSSGWPDGPEQVTGATSSPRGGIGSPDTTGGWASTGRRREPLGRTGPRWPCRTCVWEPESWRGCLGLSTASATSASSSAGPSPMPCSAASRDTGRTSRAGPSAHVTGGR